MFVETSLKTVKKKIFHDEINHALKDRSFTVTTTPLKLVVRSFLIVDLRISEWNNEVPEFLEFLSLLTLAFKVQWNSNEKCPSRARSKGATWIFKTAVNLIFKKKKKKNGKKFSLRKSRRFFHPLSRSSLQVSYIWIFYARHVTSRKLRRVETRESGAWRRKGREGVKIVEHVRRRSTSPGGS